MIFADVHVEHASSIYEKFRWQIVIRNACSRSAKMMHPMRYRERQNTIAMQATTKREEINLPYGSLKLQMALVKQTLVKIDWPRARRFSCDVLVEAAVLVVPMFDPGN